MTSSFPPWCVLRRDDPLRHRTMDLITKTLPFLPRSLKEWGHLEGCKAFEEALGDKAVMEPVFPEQQQLALRVLWGVSQSRGGVVDALSTTLRSVVSIMLYHIVF